MWEYLRDHEVQVTFPDLATRVENLVEMRCYQALLEIKDILEDPSLSDPECTMRMKYIVYTLQDYGVSLRDPPRD